MRAKIDWVVSQILQMSFSMRVPGKKFIEVAVFALLTKVREHVRKSGHLHTFMGLSRLDVLNVAVTWSARPGDCTGGVLRVFHQDCRGVWWLFSCLVGPLP